MEQTKNLMIEFAEWLTNEGWIQLPFNQNKWVQIDEMQKPEEKRLEFTTELLVMHFIDSRNGHIPAAPEASKKCTCWREQSCEICCPQT